jgi:hypothetical protein
LVRRRGQQCLDSGNSCIERPQCRVAGERNPRAARREHWNVTRKHDAVAEPLFGQHHDPAAFNGIAGAQQELARGRAAIDGREPGPGRLVDARFVKRQAPPVIANSKQRQRQIEACLRHLRGRRMRET